MKIEKLEEHHQNINALRSLNLEDCAALIGEVWRLRVAQTGKDLEVSYWKDWSYPVSVDGVGLRYKVS
jgi:hypothetical protein